ncbi:MAG: hypothetical protein CRN43_07125, partial [Candidatus Nephrothrix sp. EaCA]
MSGTAYTWTVSATSSGAGAQSVPTTSTGIEQALTATGNSSETVTYTVTGTSARCSGTVSIPVTVSPEQGVKPNVTGGGEYCVIPRNNGYKTNLTPIPIAEGTTVEWTYASFGDRLQSVTGHTQKRVRGPLTVVEDSLFLRGHAPASVYYIFRPFTDCLGLPSDTIRVRLHPIPSAQSLPPSSICSHSEAKPSATNLLLSSSGPLSQNVSYTWTADKRDAPDVTGYSEPSREGAVAAVRNPAAAATTIVDALSLPPAVTAAQTIKYRITPWHLGCPGREAWAHVQVNPLPAVTTRLPNRQHCSGEEVASVFPLEGTHGANSFKWSGGASAGLADRAEYGPARLPSYVAASVTEFLAPVQVAVSAKNAGGCEGPPSRFTISVNPKPSINPLGNPRPVCTGSTLPTATAVRIGVTPVGTKYTWRAVAVDNTADGISRATIKMREDAPPATFPVEETTLQEGPIFKKILADKDNDVGVTFYLRPVSEGCQGDEVSATVRVLGGDG